MSLHYSAKCWTDAAAICKEIGVPLHEVQAAAKAKRRQPQHVSIRETLAVRLRSCDHSYPAIAQCIGLRDHTSVMLLCRRSAKKTALIT